MAEPDPAPLYFTPSELPELVIDPRDYWLLGKRLEVETDPGRDQRVRVLPFWITDIPIDGDL